ncbi:hypothetical protein NPIL_308381 [Nephila pilipes]|uniref:Uncharacterized protein n=1 Tax=Nephila pilipes TaxID=299642 RepID=A0A8X6TNZ5_NEPPI|nr:hypothetical protein NPIL_308381 [Nephila pilipes]
MSCTAMCPKIVVNMSSAAQYLFVEVTYRQDFNIAAPIISGNGLLNCTSSYELEAYLKSLVAKQTDLK